MNEKRVNSGKAGDSFMIKWSQDEARKGTYVLEIKFTEGMPESEFLDVFIRFF